MSDAAAKSAGPSAPDLASTDVPRMRITDPAVMRAMAHPARIAVLDHLASGGTATATECARIAGLSPSAMSYHLRALAKIGLIEEAPSTGDARERRWRSVGAAAGGVWVQSAEGAPDEDRLAELDLMKAWLVRQEMHVQRWLDRWRDEPADWDRVVSVAELRVRVTAAELEEINRRVFEVLSPYAESRRTGALPDGRRIGIQFRTIPLEPPAEGGGTGGTGGTPAG